MKDVTNIFSNRLTELRGEKTIQQVADDLGISRVSMGYYEKGERKPDIEVLSMIADYYNVSADYLIGNSNIKDRSESTQDIAAQIGLSENAITKLRDLNSTNHLTGTIDTLSLLIEDSDFGYFLSVLHGYVEADDTREEVASIGGAQLKIKAIDIMKSTLQNKMIEVADNIREAYSVRYPSLLERHVDNLKQAMLNKVKEKLAQGKISKREYKKCCEEIRKGNFDYEIQEN